MMSTPPNPTRSIASKSAVMPSRVMLPSIQNQLIHGRAESGGWTKPASRSETVVARSADASSHDEARIGIEMVRARLTDGCSSRAVMIGAKLTRQWQRFQGANRAEGKDFSGRDASCLNPRAHENPRHRLRRARARAGVEAGAIAARH